LSRRRQPDDVAAGLAHELLDDVGECAAQFGDIADVDLHDRAKRFAAQACHIGGDTRAGLEHDLRAGLLEQNESDGVSVGYLDDDLGTEPLAKELPAGLNGIHDENRRCFHVYSLKFAFE
jgi:hypothetical protein